MTKITIWSSITNGGDGSAYNQWYLTQGQAEAVQDMDKEGWGEPCIDEVETYESSNIHRKALKNQENYCNKCHSTKVEINEWISHKGKCAKCRGDI